MMDHQPPALPLPALGRWQPLRLGLVELFHYDSEEFWFRDGHLLLRGNNGTGKSKVLSLTLPFLFDAQLKPSRIEPDGDGAKKMAWNLLLGRHDRRMGYTWIEFGRMDEAGTARYLTLGCGLSAAAARSQVDSWFFVLEEQRVGQDLWLMSPAKVVLTRERLRETLQALRGQVFDTASAYRRAVDERLFQLGPVRYAALMDTLVQLRQPQLSKKPDEGNLSNALTEALPPMATDLLADVADALNQLETYRRELEEYEALARAVGQFNQRYQLYAATQARRQARGLRSAQTGFDNASRVLNEGRDLLAEARTLEAQAHAGHAAAESNMLASRTRLEGLQNDPATADARQLDLADREALRRQGEAEQALRARDEANTRHVREQQVERERGQRAGLARRAMDEARSDAAACAGLAGLTPVYAANALAASGASALLALAPLALDAARKELHQAITTRRDHVALMLQHCDSVDRAAQSHARQQEARDERQDAVELAAEERARADAAVEQHGRDLMDAWQTHAEQLRQLHIPDTAMVLEALGAWTASLQGDNPARTALHAAQQVTNLRLAQHQAALAIERRVVMEEQDALLAERAGLLQGEDRLPPCPAWRAPDVRQGRTGGPLWQLVDFVPAATTAQRAGLEAALEAAGLLDAWVTPNGQMFAADGLPLPQDAQWLERPVQSQSLSAWLAPALVAAQDAAVPADVVERLLAGVACTAQDGGLADTWVCPDGRFRLGALAGVWYKPSAEFIGYAARAQARARRLESIADRLDALALCLSALQQADAQRAQDQHQAGTEWQRAPADEALRGAHLEAAARAREFQSAARRLDQAEIQLQDAATQWNAVRQTLSRDAEDLRLPPARDALHATDRALQNFGDTLHALAQAARELRDGLTEHARQQQRTEEALRDAERQVDTINAELAKRPTSTGVRFRLQWQVLPENAEGAPIGLEAARKRLLNTSTDLWSAEDRRVVGEMLQQRIAAERTLADSDQGGSLLEQLARALDYRRWHRFRVQRWQDGQWRPLSGPASSGERALGLTVPLFAAVSSYYSQAGSVHAPRLVLLDEAFAGIDDAARAHCMGLIREFDLDFVITSEREWACYAELPGVAIAQLQRREGIDAVHVSRWTWDGRARRREDDPDRRFPAP